MTVSAVRNAPSEFADAGAAPAAEYVAEVVRVSVTAPAVVRSCFSSCFGLQHLLIMPGGVLAMRGPAAQQLTKRTRLFAGVLSGRGVSFLDYAEGDAPSHMGGPSA